MRRRVRIHELAQDQIDAAIDWWMTNRQAAPSLLEGELARSIALIGAFPDGGQRIDGSVRRRLLRRTRYAIFYVVSTDGDVEVVRFVHMSRDDRR